MAPSSNAFTPPLQPLFTREILTQIEAELFNDGEFLETKNAEGRVSRVRNRARGGARTYRRPSSYSTAPSASTSGRISAPANPSSSDDEEAEEREREGEARKGRVLRNIVYFRGEREMLEIERRRAEEMGERNSYSSIASRARTGAGIAEREEERGPEPEPDTQQYFFPVYPSTTYVSLANRSAEETCSLLRAAIADFENTREARAITALIKTHLRGCAVDKVIMFGLGALSHDQLYYRCGARHQKLAPFREHAAARVIHAAVREVSSVREGVDLLVQDPLYTDVCKAVLEDPKHDFGFQVVGGFGAKGFALIDDNSVVLAHHPSFPFRELVADMARPAMICMRKRTWERDEHYDIRADVDTVRSNLMLEEYREVDLREGNRCLVVKAFYDNVWYVRDDIGALPLPPSPPLADHAAGTGTGAGTAVDTAVWMDDNALSYYGE